MNKTTSSAYILPGTKNINYQPEDVIKDVCSYFNIQVSDMISKSRKRRHAEPRHIAMWLIRSDFNLTLKHIGDMFGRDHATVIYAHKTVVNLRVEYNFNRQVEDLIKKIEEGILISNKMEPC